MGFILVYWVGFVECGVKWLFCGKFCGEGMILDIWCRWLELVLIESIVLSRFWVYLWMGCVSILCVVFCFMIWFVYIMVIWCESLVMRVRLCEMNISVNLSFCCRCISSFMICVCIVMLRVVVGLLVIISCGLWVRVIVMSMCCCWLFDSLCGYEVSVCFGLRLMSFSSFLVVWVLLWDVSCFICVWISIVGFSEFRVFW